MPRRWPISGALPVVALLAGHIATGQAERPTGWAEPHPSMVAPSRVASPPVLVNVGCGQPATSVPVRTNSRVRLGCSYRGRPIDLVRVGDPAGTRILVVGCIHGTEPAGLAIVRALGRTRTRADLWMVPNLNPDGYLGGNRQNGRGVDLNANWSSQWHPGGRPWDTYYPGPRPFSERETRIARDLIDAIRPQVTIWYHQHLNLVWAWGPSTRAGGIYARAAGMRFYHRHWLNGTAPNWQNHHLPATASMVVELPAGTLPPGQVGRHLRAIEGLRSSF